MIYPGRPVPGDAEDGVTEARLEVGEVHGVHVLVQDQLAEVLQDLVDVGVALRVAEVGPGAPGDGHLPGGVILAPRVNSLQWNE